MTQTIVFATNRMDAQAYCNDNALIFEDVVWVMNVQLLGDMDTTGADVHYTEDFTDMPAYHEALARFS